MKKYIINAFEWKSKTDSKLWDQYLIIYLMTFILRENYSSFYEFYNVLKEKSPEDAVFLSPMVIACQYFLKGKDANVLDRLNPELRELVEIIIKKISGSKKNS